MRDTRVTINEGTRIDEQLWYYLHRSRQVGPYSRGELDFLLARGVLSRTTLVWTPGNDGWRALGELPQESDVPKKRRPRNWVITGLGMAIFVGAVSMVAKAPTVGETVSLSGVLSWAQNLPPQFSRVPDRELTRMTEVAVTDFDEATDLTEDCVHFSPINGCFVLRPMHLTLPSPPREAQASAPAEKLAVEYWRSIGSSTSLKLYALHRDQPAVRASATAKAMNIRKQIKKAQLNPNKSASAKQKVASLKADQRSLTKPAPSRTSNVKAATGCQNRTVNTCKSPCRERESWCLR